MLHKPINVIRLSLLINPAIVIVIITIILENIMAIITYFDIGVFVELKLIINTPINTNK